MNGKTRLPEPRISLFPTPVVIVTAKNYDGEVGATTIAWTGVISSRPPVLGVSFLPDSFTRKCIVETREFVINIPGSDALDLVRICGARSGSVTGPSPHEDANCVVPGMTLLPADVIRAPLIAECFLNFECRLLSTVQLGLYDCFLGQVLTAHCDDDVYRNDHPRGNVDHAQAQPAFCLGDQYWSAGEFLGVSAENKNHPHGAQH
jgi:flavin reductase (DIM6/NTAB) family NADH-FMN oxidoreductase RutF